MTFGGMVGIVYGIPLPFTGVLLCILFLPGSDRWFISASWTFSSTQGSRAFDPNPEARRGLHNSRFLK